LTPEVGIRKLMFRYLDNPKRPSFFNTPITLKLSIHPDTLPIGSDSSNNEVAISSPLMPLLPELASDSL
jgi:hypothetical protein